MVIPRREVLLSQVYRPNEPATVPPAVADGLVLSLASSLCPIGRRTAEAQYQSRLHRIFSPNRRKPVGRDRNPAYLMVRRSRRVRLSPGLPRAWAGCAPFGKFRPYPTGE